MQKTFSSLLYSAFCLALIVIVLGAYTRLSDAGLGCPDWPGCYGNLTVPEEVNNEQFQRPLETAKAWKEMIHRYAAGTLGVIILFIFLISVFYRRQIKQNFLLPTILLATVVFQALLGMWTVTHLLSPMIVTAHLIGGFSTLALIWWLVLRHRFKKRLFGNHQAQPSYLRILALIGLLLLIVQITLGGWTSTNYAALACGNTFPSCQGVWLPEQNFTQGFNLSWQTGVNYEFGRLESAARTAIHYTHRIGALAMFLLLGFLASKLLKYKLGPSTPLALFFLLTQVCLGILNVVLSLPLWIAVAHTLTAALLLLAVISVNFRIYHYRNL